MAGDRDDMAGGEDRRAPAGAGTGAGVEPCPICGRPADPATRPFCSRRCANVDLHRWLTGAYAIPVVEDEDEDGGPPTGEFDA